MIVRNEHGFAMFPILAVLMAISLVSMAAFAAVDGDLPSGQADLEARQALAAAEAGIEQYAYALRVNPELYDDCTAPPASSGVTINGVISPGNGGRWVTLPGGPMNADGTQIKPASYRLEILPSREAVANGEAGCVDGGDGSGLDRTERDRRVINRGTGTIRIRATGRSGPRGKRRSVIATFRRTSAADWVYFSASEGNIDAWPGLEWRSTDRVSGPVHTEDSIAFCGSPQIGWEPTDRVELFGLRARCADGVPRIRGKLNLQAPSRQLPNTNETLSRHVLSDYRFFGGLRLNFTTSSIEVSKRTGWPTSYWEVEKTLPYPSNGLIWIDDGGLCGGRSYDINDPYNADFEFPNRCAVAYVRGTYSKNITIASAQDIVVDEDFKASGDVVAALIAEQNVRVFRPIDSINPWGMKACPYDRDQDNWGDVDTIELVDGLQSPEDIRIEAAIVAVNGMFVVDNYWCGGSTAFDPDGYRLEVKGSVAQNIRGGVGRTWLNAFGSRFRAGYYQKYDYDPRLKTRLPPYFLAADTAPWLLESSQEQVPAQ